MLDDPRSPAGLEWHARFPPRFQQLPRFAFLARGAERGAQRLQLRNYLHGHTLGSHRRHSPWGRGVVRGLGRKLSINPRVRAPGMAIAPPCVVA